jgi:exonuclease SbcC
MLPRHITLKNFLSYREASLDFTGLHVVCIAGANGAGKSSLLEAIGWALWGQSRVATEDDIIYQGEMEARVAFVFQQGEHVYRVIRHRHRLQGAGLEFQIKAETGYRVLTQRGVRATQQLICRCLRLDYETFLNSAYLRQGQADDFMLKRPSDRKEILASLLKLDRYDQLAEQAKEQARQARAEAELRRIQLDELAALLANYDTTVAQQAQLQHDLQALEQAQEQAQQQLLELKQLEQSYQSQQKQIHLYRQQQEQLLALHRQTQNAIAEAQIQQQHFEQLIAQAPDIEAGVSQCQALEIEDSQLNQQFRHYQALQHQRQTLEAEYEAKARCLQNQRQRHRTQLDAIQTQLDELTQVLSQADDIQAARQQLSAAKSRLKRLDGLQLQVEPLRRRQQQIHTEVQRQQTRLQTRLESLQAAVKQHQSQQTQKPQLATAAEEVNQTLLYLEQRRVYQEQVREKGLERRSFVDTLQATQRTCEAQIAEVEQKLRLLEQPEAVCPLCDRPLDARHRTLVTDRHHLQQQDLQEQIWVIREQLAVSEREIQVLRQEYRAVEAELANYAPVLNKQGQLEAQMASHSTAQQQLQQLQAECQQLQACLRDRRYATDLQAELTYIEQTLAQLAYDERDHALARGQVNRLRWADIKHHELTQARRRQHQLTEQHQALEAQWVASTAQLAELKQSPLKAKLDDVQQAIHQLSYGIEHHQQVRCLLQEAQSWRLRQQELAQARRQQPPVDQQLAELQAQQQQQQQDLAQLTASLTALETALNQQIYRPDEAAQLEVQIKAQQQQRDSRLAELGALTQARQHLESLQQQLDQKQQEWSTVRQQQQVYHELAQAFGRKGIQAMMIENLLPQLEAETNQILGKLSGHQMHIRFATQRTSKRHQQKLIDTLDILIADAHGTRPYETYSGGEAFRVNFAIRLALARLLAQRSGVALQLLIIDEGFGSQDQQGCDRLIAAINAIAADFACILAVTHIPHFKEAFQTRIDVIKTQVGSQLEVAT